MTLQIENGGRFTNVNETTSNEVDMIKNTHVRDDRDVYFAVSADIAA